MHERAGDKAEVPYNGKLPLVAPDVSHITETDLLERYGDRLENGFDGDGLKPEEEIILLAVVQSARSDPPQESLLQRAATARSVLVASYQPYIDEFIAGYPDVAAQARINSQIELEGLIDGIDLQAHSEGYIFRMAVASQMSRQMQLWRDTMKSGTRHAATSEMIGDIGKVGLQQIMADLSPAMQHMLTRRYIDGASNRIVAEELGVSMSTSSNRLLAAVERLRRIYVQGLDNPVSPSRSIKVSAQQLACAQALHEGISSARLNRVRHGLAIALRPGQVIGLEVANNSMELRLNEVFLLNALAVVQGSGVALSAQDILRLNLQACNSAVQRSNVSSGMRVFAENFNRTAGLRAIGHIQDEVGATRWQLDVPVVIDTRQAPGVKAGREVDDTDVPSLEVMEAYVYSKVYRQGMPYAIEPTVWGKVSQDTAKLIY